MATSPKVRGLTAAGYVLQALAQPILDALRDAPDALTWATAHNLNGPPIIHRAEDLRKLWNSRPRDGRKVVPIWLAASFRPLGPDERAWIKDHSGERCLPNPECETLAAYLARCEALYRERARFAYGDRLPRRAAQQPDRLFEHCEWFVAVHVNGIRPASLAQSLELTPAAVEMATRSVARLLGVRRRTWPRGRQPAHTEIK